MDNNAIILSVINSKGGVGKTTISSNISHVLSLAGYRVLHADFDPQGSSTETFQAIDGEGHRLSKNYILSLDIFRLLFEPVNTTDYIFSTAYENLDIIPNAQGIDAIYDNGSFDVRFENCRYPSKHTALLHNLEQVCGIYDFIIIDGQPNINSMMEISIIASDAVVSPAYPDKFNLSTVNNTCAIIDHCNQKYGRNTQYLGFFLNAVTDLKDPAYQTLCDFYVEHGMEYFIDNPIRSSKFVNKSGLNNKLWFDYGLNCSITFPNPCRDLLRLMVKELDLMDEEHIRILLGKGIKRSYFE